MTIKGKKFNVCFFKGSPLVDSNFSLKKLFLMMSLIILSFIGCEGNKTSENSNFKKESSSKTENYLEREKLDKGKKKSWGNPGGKVSKKKKTPSLASN